MTGRGLLGEWSIVAESRRRVTLVKGRSAWELAAIERTVGWVSLVLMVVAFAVAVVPSTLPLGVRYAFAAIGGVCAVLVYNAFVLSGYVSVVKEDVELKAGYTTSPVMHRPEVDLVLPRSGVVVRAAGEKAMAVSEYRALVKAGRGSTSELPRKEGMRDVG